MTQEMIELLKDLADVLEKHKGGMTYTTADDGIRVTLGEDWGTQICIGWPMNGNVEVIRRIISQNAQGEARRK